jgi:hypothetical protein
VTLYGSTRDVHIPGLAPAAPPGDILPTFDIEPEEIIVFPVEDEYWFSHYFDREDLFERLREYYNAEAYRFEIPAEEFEPVREELAGEYIDLVVAETLDSYCVVTEQYTEYGDRGCGFPGCRTTILPRPTAPVLAPPRGVAP